MSDGVEQMPPVGLVKYQVPQDLAVDVSILQQDLSAKSLHDAPVGGASWLDHCGKRGRLGPSSEPLGQPEVTQCERQNDGGTRVAPFNRSKSEMRGRKRAKCTESLELVMGCGEGRETSKEMEE